MRMIGIHLPSISVVLLPLANPEATAVVAVTARAHDPPLPRCDSAIDEAVQEISHADIASRREFAGPDLVHSDHG